MKQADVSSEVSKVMTNALCELQRLVTEDPSKQHDVLMITKTFLMGVISTAVDLTEVRAPGSAPFLFADIEAVAKSGGLRAI